MAKRYLDAPVVVMNENEDVTKVLLNFYMALGWNGFDTLNPKKVRANHSVYENIRKAMLEKCPNVGKVGVFLMNYGPSVCNSVPHDKVQLLNGWVA